MDNDRIARNLKCVEKHFHSEAVDEVEAALDLYTDDIVWDAPALNLQRFATEDRVVDDSIVTFEIARAGYWPWPADARELVFDMGRPVRA